MNRKSRVQILITGVLWSLLSAAFFLYKHAPIRGWIFGLLAGIFIGSALFVPGLAAILHVVLATLVEILVTSVTWLLLGIAFFVVVLPLGLVLRMTGSLRTSRRPAPGQDSYWVDRKPEPISVGRYLRPF